MLSLNDCIQFSQETRFAFPDSFYFWYKKAMDGRSKKSHRHRDHSKSKSSSKESQKRPALEEEEELDYVSFFN